MLCKRATRQNHFKFQMVMLKEWRKVTREREKEIRKSVLICIDRRSPFYGLLFKEDEEAAFASYYLFSSLGWTTSFLYSDHICTDIKIYLLLSTSFLGTIGYFLTERSYSLRKQKATLRRKRASQM
ncbi:UNVERIFIED_CONTAM: UNC93-like protein [Trichonephila clavipes]